MTGSLPRFWSRTKLRNCRPARIRRSPSRRLPLSRAARFEPSNVPFEMLEALSLSPALLRIVARLLVVISFAAAPVRAADADPGAAPVAVSTIAVAVATNGTAASETNPLPVIPAVALSTNESAKEVTQKTTEVRAKAPAPAPVVAPAPAKTNLPPTNLEAFKLIADRNIFNQSRSPRVSSASRPSETNEVRRVPRIEAFALVGTMSFEKGDFAFFDSGASQYRKTIKPGDEIAGYRLKEVKPNQVTMVQGDAAIEVKVGQQLRREEDGPWQVIAHTGSFAVGSSGASTSPSSGGSSSSGGSASEILKRLMEQRAKER